MNPDRIRIVLSQQGPSGAPGGIGLAAARPAASAVPAGSRYYATDTGVESISDGVATWYALPAQAVAYYVNTATGSDSNAGTAAAPFATFGKAWTSVLPGQAATITLAANQTFPLTAALTIAAGAVVTVVGVYGSQLGSRTAAAGSTSTVVNDAAGGLTASASRGDRLLFDANTATVALRGTGFTIRQNTTTSFTTWEAMPATPAAGDTFTVQRTTSKLQWTTTQYLDLTNGELQCDAVEWNSNAATNPNAQLRIFGTHGQSARLMCRGTRFTRAGAGAGQLGLYGVSAVFGTLKPIPLALFQNPSGTLEHGCYFANGAPTNSNYFGNHTEFMSVRDSGCGIGVNDHCRYYGSAIDLVGAGFICGWETAFFEIVAPSTLGASGVNSIASNTSAGINITFAGKGFIGPIDISNCAGAGILITNNSSVDLSTSGITGTGNTGAGVECDIGSRVVPLGTNTITGTAGDILVDGVTHTWSQYPANALISSNLRSPGMQVNFAGGLTGGAGTTTVYIPIGGVPSATNGTGNSATAMRYPLAIGSPARNLRLTVLTNALTTATVFTAMKAPVATGVPAATAITFSVAATTTGSFADTTHAATYQDGDQLDLQAANTAGGASPLTATAALQLS